MPPTNRTNNTSASLTIGFTVILQKISSENANGTVSSYFEDGWFRPRAYTSEVWRDDDSRVYSINMQGGGVAQFGDSRTSCNSYGSNTATALAADGLGRTFVTDTNGTASALTSSGTAAFNNPVVTTAGVSTPIALSVDSAGSLWIASCGDSSAVEVIGVVAPVATSAVNAVKNSNTGTRPEPTRRSYQETMMKTFNKTECRTLSVVAATTLSLVLAGCSGFQAATVAPAAAAHGTALHGSVHGGQQPVVGANIALYVASTAGYGAANTNILTTAVSTDNNGGFSITGDYPCTAGQQMYLIASGGNPGAGTNANETVMAALGDCAALNSATFININEVTTVGSVFALAPFMSATTAVGTSSTNTAGLVRAFASVNKLVNIATGTSIGSALPANAVGPSSEINSLADSLATCVNSAGGVAGDNMTNCGSLFQLATPPGGTAPTDTVQATLNIALNPTLNTTAIFNLAPAASPFQPQLAQAQTPADWTMSVKYKNVGLGTPTSATVDGNGQVWFANSASNSVTVLAQTGAPIAASPIGGNGLAGPAAVAIDASGNAWVANKTGNSVSVFTGTGTASSTTTGGGNLSGPTALAFDAPGNLWIANTTGNSLVELNSSGTYVTQVTSGISAPTAVAINPK